MEYVPFDFSMATIDVAIEKYGRLPCTLHNHEMEEVEEEVARRAYEYDQTWDSDIRDELTRTRWLEKRDEQRLLEERDA